MKYSFYPGCAAHSTGLENGLSTRATFQYLGLELNELSNWSCCGASSAHAVNQTLGHALPARNIALAQEAGYDLVTPCAACFNRLKTADYTLRNDPEIRAEIETIADFIYSGEIRIRPVLGALYEDCGLDKISDHIRRPLEGLKIVTYYGCLYVRPPEVTQFDDAHNPQMMAHVLRSVGADVKPWSYATDCCGAGLSLSRPDVVFNLVDRLVEHAREAGADALATACPLCQLNLEMRQSDDQKMPTFYFTELLGLAFDLPESKMWWTKHLIDPRPLLRSIGLV